MRHDGEDHAPQAVVPDEGAGPMMPALYSRMDMNRAALRRAMTFARPPRVEKPSLGDSSLNLPGGFGRPALSISRVCAKRSGAVAGYADNQRRSPVLASLLLSVGVCGSLAGATAPVFSIWLRPMSIPGSPPSVQWPERRKTARFFRARLTFPRTRHAAKPRPRSVNRVSFVVLHACEARMEIGVMSSNKTSESVVSSVVAASLYLHEIAGNQRVKSAINFVVSVFPRWSYAKTRMVWYADERAHVSDEDLQALSELREARKSYRGLLERIERLEAALAVSDPDMFGPQIDALRRSRGRPDRPVG
jgi:hypothetical protein